MDFIIRKYRQFLNILLDKEYRFVTFEQYCDCRDRGDALPERYIIMRHDVEALPENSYAFAQIEYELGIQASYYFRVIKASNQPEYIRAIAALGHEIGYHYEDMAICNGNVEQAYSHFQQQLQYFRQFYPVRTICMHGAPTSKWDGRELWRTYDYRTLDIIGEPYFDVDFSDVFYLTDTGRCWDGFNVSVRDKIPTYQDQWIEQGLIYHTTDDLIHALNRGQLPKHIMITTHPQRWANNILAWSRELLMQSLKNMIKRILVLMQK
ncbi:MAG: hypothetical protein IJV81_08045 [Paludibacteraceae bacterium]|nr:hypothetical protein [Paludibacteraceae bacterium]